MTWLGVTDSHCHQDFVTLVSDTETSELCNHRILPHIIIIIINVLYNVSREETLFNLVFTSVFTKYIILIIKN